MTHISEKTNCTWGILGTAFIARKNWQAIRDAGNAKLIAVASRDLAKAQAFVNECQTQVPHENTVQAVGSYEALIDHPEINALYIPLPTGIRKEWVIRAAKAGKHVLVEKPVGCSAGDVREIIDVCKANNVQFMDGVMFMHNERLRMMKGAIDGGAIGEVRRISSQFSFPGDDAFFGGNIRVSPALEPLGCLGDLGWYNVRLSLWAMNYAEPVQVSARAIKQQDGVPVELSGELIFASGASATFFNSFATGHAQWANISGTKGYLSLNDFVLPFATDTTEFAITQTEFHIDNCQFDMIECRTPENIVEPPSNAPGSQEARLFQNFSQLVIEGRRDNFWPDVTLLTQRVMDACMKSAAAGGAHVTL